MRPAIQIMKRFVSRDKLKLERNGLCHTGRQWKIKFITKSDAEKYNYRNMAIYKCKKCNHYHLTNMKVADDPR